MALDSASARDALGMAWELLGIEYLHGSLWGAKR
jgi:hypothetical protein